MNKRLPSVSVIIPCFNCEQWINNCLYAIERQTYCGPIEIVCVDDASSDNTVRLIEEASSIARHNIKLLRNVGNLGPAMSRNIGIEAAVGEWIAFCDSDDWFDDTFIEEMLDAAFTHNSELVMCNYKKIPESNSRVLEVDYLATVPRNPSVEQMVIHSKASLCLLFVNRTVLRGIEIPNLRNGEDIAIVPIIESKVHNIAIVRRPLYNYYVRRSSASNRVSKTVFHSLCLAYDYILENLDSSFAVAKEYLGIRTVLYGATLAAFKAGNDLQQVRAEIEKFEKVFPKWYKNDYVGAFSTAKRVYLLMIRFRCYRICKLLATLHGRLSV